MDTTDFNIIEVLKKNGRATSSEISKQVNLSIPAVSERIRKMEQSKIIEQYTVKINRQKAGYSLIAFVLVNIEKTKYIGQFRNEIITHSCILECHHIAGPNDYLLKVLVKDTSELEHYLTYVLKKIDGVTNSITLICLSTLKEEINREENKGNDAF